jgi:hypothetical protein
LPKVATWLFDPATAKPMVGLFVVHVTVTVVEGDRQR